MMAPAPLRAPVALMIFNRPQFTAQVFERIAAARPRRLFVVADGPRADHPDDVRLCSQTRAVIERVDWTCEVETNYAEANLGCKQRIASGLDWVFARTEEAIILEDDTVPALSFFAFCDELLERYREAPRVQMISGCNVLPADRSASDSYYFSRCHHVWGWASWARAWSGYDIEMRDWPVRRESGWLEGLLGGPTEVEIARAIFDATHAGEVPTWDFQLVFASWARDGLSVIPRDNLVTNIGYGDLGSHERDPDHPFARLPASEMSFPLRHPNTIEANQEADRAEWRLAYRGRFRDAELVLGAAVGYTRAQVVPFLTSLRRAGSRARVVLIVDPALASELRRAPVIDDLELVTAPQWPPMRHGFVFREQIMGRAWFPAARLLLGLARAAPVPEPRRVALHHALATRLLTPMEARFLRYQRIVEDSAADRILLTDVRDVVFQSDPFAAIPSAGLSVSLESDGYTLASEPLNADWITRVYGEAMLRRIGHHRVANVGVTIGGREAVTRYLELMVGEITAMSPARAGIGGADTAVHNVLLRTGRLGSVRELAPLESPVANLNGIDDAGLAVGSDGRLLNRDGSVPSIVHQYDRQARLRDRLPAALLA